MGTRRFWVSGMLVATLVILGTELSVTATPSEIATSIAQATEPDAAAIERAAALSQQAFELWQAGQYQEAIFLVEEAQAIFREQLGENHPDVASGLNNLAVLYINLGQYDKANPLLQDALAIFREQLGERHPEVAVALNTMATSYQNQGRYSEAEPLFLEALSISREQLGERHLTVATRLNNLGLLYQEQGRYDEAEPLLETALDIRREQLESRHPLVALSYNNLGTLYEAQERYDEAETLFQAALGIRRSRLGESHPAVAISLNNLASLYDSQGNYSEAEPLYREALSINREQFGNRHPDVAINLNNLAALYRNQGLYSEAEPLYQEALSIRQEFLGERHPSVGRNISNLTALYLASGQKALAVRTLQLSLDIEEWNLGLNLTAFTENQRQDYAATFSGSTDFATFLSLQIPDARTLGLTTLLRRKGRLLEVSSSSFQRLRQNLTQADQELMNEFVVVRQQLATLTFNPPANLPPEDYRAELGELETKATDLEKTLAQRSAVFRAESEPVEIAAVQTQIPTDGVLVEYARYRPFDAQADLADRFGDPHYAAYLLFPNGRIEAIDLGDAAEIDAAVQSFVGLLQNRRADFQRSAPVPTLREADIEQVTDNIKELVFDPIAPYLQEVDHLLISPDSQLNLLPFEALQTEAGGEYLVQQYQISYLNSGRDLLKFDLIEPSQNPAVILANPDYETADFLPQGDAIANDSAQSTLASEPRAESRGDNRRSTELSQLKVDPLPGTAAEAEAIRPLLPQATFLTEAEATENLIKSVQAPRILHIATHGFFLPDVERPETDALASFGTLSGDGGFPSGIVTENPLLRSGLALAGFNTRSSGSEDGVFTALEASQLNLFGTQLVVLSACETGLGEVANGEGVYGLRRAFALAGAETQLMSLWNVSDYGTQSLMARYYENLTAGMGRSEALREVQLEMIEQGGEYSHPYYWAAFILAGDWRPLE